MLNNPKSGNVQKCGFTTLLVDTESNYINTYQNERTVNLSLSGNPDGQNFLYVQFGTGAVAFEVFQHPVAHLSLGGSGDGFSGFIKVTPDGVGTVDLPLHVDGSGEYANSDTYTFHVTVTA